MATNDYSHTLFKYDPSIPAAAIFVGAFLITTVCHLYQLLRLKSFYFTVLLVCGIAEVTGYSCRLASRQDPSNVSLYSAHYAFLVLAPIFLVASMYVMLSRIIRFVDYPSLISAKRIAIIFITADIITFLVQIFGAILLLNRSNISNITRGKNILLAGLIIQIITFAFFTIVAIHFDIVVAKSGRHGGKWRWLMKALYAACALVLIRSIFRVVEFSQSTTSYLQTTEWPTYIFDALLMFTTMVIFNIIHPGKYLVTDSVELKNNTRNTNKIGVIDMPVAAAETAKRNNSIQNIELA